MINIRTSGSVLGNADAARETFLRERTSELRTISPKLLQVVTSGMDAAGMVRRTGKVAGWQEHHLGSGGGYAAVRPVAKTFHKGYAVGYITNALESGHRVRYPSGYSKRYVPKVTRDKTRAFLFYKNSEREATRLAQEAAERVAQKVATALEGG